MEDRSPHEELTRLCGSSKLIHKIVVPAVPGSSLDVELSSLSEVARLGDVPEVVLRVGSSGEEPPESSSREDGLDD